MIKNILWRLPKDELEEAAEALMEAFEVGLDGLTFEFKESRVNKEPAWFLAVDPNKVDRDVWEAQTLANVRHTFWGYPWGKRWQKYPKDRPY